jgi:hypothetical protein
MQIGNKKITVILILHFYEVLDSSVIISQMQFPGRTYATNNSFHGAKVSNFYIFDTDEIDIEESTQLPVCDQCDALLLFALPLSLVLLPQARQL